MKYIFAYCLVLASIHGVGQKSVLLDKKLQKPIIFTDTVTQEQINHGYIPVELKDLDTFYADLNYLEAILSNRDKTNLSSFELRAGSSVFMVTRLLRAINEGERYNICLNSTIKEVSSRYILANGNKTNREVKYDVKDLKNYLNSISKYFHADYEIYPKMYNVLVIPD